MFREVDRLYLQLVFGACQSLGDFIDTDNAGGTFDLAPLRNAQSYRTQTLDSL